MKKWVCSLLLLSACAVNPVTGKRELSLVSQRQEIALGEENYGYLQQAQGGLYTADPALQAYVESVGRKLAAVSDRPELPYEFVILNQSIPNAWALSGGKIAIYRGLLTELKNEAELAAVLSHEIVHSAARHGAKTFERLLLMQVGLFGLQQVLKDHKYETLATGAAGIGAGLIGLKYSRDAELEADRFGMKYMAAAGYSPQAAVSLQEMFSRLDKEKSPIWLEGLFATHPPSQERQKLNEQQAPLYPQGILGEEPFAQAIQQLQQAKGAYADLDKGIRQLLKGELEAALSSAEEGLRKEPNERHLHNLKGKALARLNRPLEALAAFEVAIEFNANYFDDFLQKGRVQKQLGQLQTARVDLERSLSLLPSAEAHLALGEISLQEGKMEEAMSHFRVAAQADCESGVEAGRELAYLELPKHPADYLSVTAEWERKGHLTLYLKNHGPVAVQQVEVLATLPHSQEVVRLRLPGPIEPGQTLLKTFQMSVSPGRGVVQATVESAEALK